MPTDRPSSVELPFRQHHAFVIGIDAYQHLSPLSTAVNDARVLAEQLREHHGYTVHGPLLDATKADLTQLLEVDMPELVGEEDRVLFYFAGHGIALDSDDEPNGYLIPADARPGDKDTLLSMHQLHDALEALPCRHGLLIMDCCFAGAFRWSIGFRDAIFDLPGIIYEERFYRYAADPAWQVITSSAADQKAVDILANHTLGWRGDGEAKHSPFALALLEGLMGAADTIPRDQADGVITATELYVYLRDRVESDTHVQGTRQSPAIFSLQRHDKGQYIFLNPRHPLNLPPIPRRNPFMGLRSYNEADQLLFYGRDRVVAALDALVATAPLTVVSGASGTGKSSVIKAGLLPRLRKAGRHILPVVRPGKEPLRNLQEAIPDPQATFRVGEPILVIDQYEELITQCLDPDERTAFEIRLAEWLTTYPQLRLILSVRSDFEPQFENEILAAWWQAGRYVVPTFSSDELREVIVKPASQEVFFFAPAELVDGLVDAVNQAPGALPLLSFTLSELYYAYLDSGRTDRAFTRADYDHLGGVIGALRTRANAIYDNLDVVHQDSMRQLMIRMVSLEGGELASRRVSNDDLVFSSDTATQRTQAVAQQLVAARLVSTGLDKEGQTYYEPAHDALVRAWGRLWEWIKAQGEAKLGLMYKLSLAVADYESHADQPRANDYLWNDDPRLDLLYADLDGTDHGFNAREERFLRASMDLRRRNTRRRRMVVATAMIVLAAISVVALWQRDIAQRQTELAQAQTAAATRSDSIAQVEANNARIQADSALAAQLRAERSDSVAGAERDEAVRQTGIAETQRDRAVRQANIAEARRLSGLTMQLVENRNYSDALHTALAAYRKANPKPLETYQAFSRLLFEHGLDSLPVIVNNYTDHSGAVRLAIFSPDGQRLVTASDDHTANLYDLQGRRLTSFTGHEAQVTSVTFSPNGRLLATASADGTAKLWNLSGRELTTLKGHDDSVLSVVFSPEGQYLATASVDGKAKVWDQNGREIVSLNGHQGIVRSVNFSPDGQYLITASSDHTAKLWDKDGRKLFSLEGHKGGVTSAEFSPDGQRLATASYDRTARVWDLGGQQLVSLKGHEGEIMWVAFSPNGQHLVTASGDHTARLWSLDGEQLGLLAGHEDRVLSASFSGDGQRVITSSEDYTAKMWDLNGQELASLGGHDNRVISAVFSLDGKRVLTASEDFTAKMWCLRNTYLTSLNGHEGAVYVATFSADGQHLFTASADHTAKLWDRSGRQLASLEGHDGKVFSVSFSSDGKHLATAAEDRTAKLWDKNGRQLVSLIGHKAWVSSVAFSPNGQRLVTASGDHTAIVWDLKGRQLVTLTGHSGDVLSAVFSPDGQYLLTASGDHTAKFWNLRGEELFTMKRHTGAVNSAIFSPDGQYLLTASSDGTVKLWNRSGQYLATLKLHESRILTASFSPDGQLLVTASSDGTARLWDLSSRQLATFKSHDGWVYSAVFSPDGQSILTASGDGTAKLWPAPAYYETFIEQLGLATLSKAKKREYGLE